MSAIGEMVKTKDKDQIQTVQLCKLIARVVHVEAFVGPFLCDWAYMQVMEGKAQQFPFHNCGYSVH